MSNSRILFIVALFMIAALLWFASDVLLLGFAGIVFGVFLRAVGHLVSRSTGLSAGWSTLIGILLIVALIALAAWLLAPSIADQTQSLAKQLPQSIQSLKGYIGQYGWGRRLISDIPSVQQAFPLRQNFLSRVTGIVSTTYAILVDVIVILFLGLYLALNPQLYVAGIRHLVPSDRRKRAVEVVEQVGNGLRWWVLGQGISMGVVGSLTVIGLWMIGIPAYLTLGLIAGLSEVIPSLGPVLGYIPILLVGLASGPGTALSVTVLYLIVQTVESWVLMPLVHKKTVSLPPAVTILNVVLLGSLAGGLGALLATPLAVVALVIIRMLYVRDYLGDTSVPDGLESAH